MEGCTSGKDLCQCICAVVLRLDRLQRAVWRNVLRSSHVVRQSVCRMYKSCLSAWQAFRFDVCFVTKVQLLISHAMWTAFVILCWCVVTACQVCYKLL
jgi:hypothetical protein